MPLYYLPYLFDVVAQSLAVAVIAFASQSAQLTHRDSPIAVILFATSSILLFTLPRVGGNSKLPHIAVLAFGLSTVVAYLFDVIRGECNLGVIIGNPPDVPADALLCRKAVITWWLDVVLFIWIKIVLIWNAVQSRRLPAEEEVTNQDDEHHPLLGD